MELTVSSFFKYYIFHPMEQKKRSDRLIALTSSIALGVLTLGVSHLIVYTAIYQKNFTVVKEANQRDQKVKELFKQKVAKEEEEPSGQEEALVRTDIIGGYCSQHDAVGVQ